MDKEWGAVLERHKIPYFHMVDCAHGNGVFKNMPVVQRAEIVANLIALIKKYTEEGFVFLAKADSYDPPENDAPNPYSYCAAGCVEALYMFLNMRRVEANIAYFFEEGHKHKGKAYNHIANSVKREQDSLTFAAKEKVRLLQAADLLAWQSAKYAKDYSFARAQGQQPKRQPRKDFLSLMEHDHSFMYIGPGKGMYVELWPISKRSQFTTQINVGDDGPVTYWREEGDDTPIIPVERAVGFRMGGGRMAYAAFNGFGDKKFALAFDEPRLYEAIMSLVAAASLYANDETGPVLPAGEVHLAGC